MLDPEDRLAYRALAHRMLDESLDDIETLRSGPVWRPVPAEVRASFAASEPPASGAPLAAVYERYRELIAPFSVGNRHPRFFGWVHGNGTPSGMLGAMLAAGLNANCGGREHAAVYAERELVRWWTKIFGFPTQSSGIVTTGTSLATITAFAVARLAKLGADVRTGGMHGASRRPEPTAYACSSVHNCVGRALDILGIGSEALRKIPPNATGGIDLAALQREIAADRSAGRTPFLLVGTLGSVDTGASDGLLDLAAVAQAENLWFHVDGAFGAMAILSSAEQAITAGIELADSLATDFHKWLHAPYGAGLMLTRHPELHRATFAAHANYLHREQAGTAGGDPWFCDFGMELSRGFSALPIWLTMQEFGLERLGAVITMNCAMARDLGAQLAHIPGLVPAAPVRLNIVTMQLDLADCAPLVSDAMTAALAIDLQESGLLVPSTTRIAGRTVLRFNLTNHRIIADDITITVNAVTSGLERIIKRFA